MAAPIFRHFLFVVLLAGTFLFAVGFAQPCYFDVWDCPYQCHGDADCAAEGKEEFRVSDYDLAILMAVYNGLDWPAYYPESPNYEPSADFDRDFDVDDTDEDILLEYYNQPDVPNDCPKKLELASLEGDCIVADTNYVIEWQWRIFTDPPTTPGPRDIPGPIKIYYSTTGDDWTLIDTVVDGNSYNWFVPSEVFQQCWLEIEDTNHPGLTDTKYWTYECTVSYDSDWNGDCYVKFDDFAIIAESWLEPGGTDANDLASLADEWCLCSNVCDSQCVP